MAIIQINDLSFTYPGALAPVFENVSLNLDTSWRLGLIGRNGRGKTTFLRLLLGELQGTGGIHSPEQFEYFPFAPPCPGRDALAVARGAVAPFDEWQQHMQALASGGTPDDMQAYGEMEEQFAAADGYVIDELIAAEAGRLGIHESALGRPFETLSPGEQVKLLLAAVFLKKHRFLLIDEPTDHLDAEGRETVAAWLAGKSGFILVSHDRAFLNRSVDHILAINRAGIELQKGNYASWRHNRTLQDEFEKAENRRLGTEIKRLESAARRTSSWSNQIEKTKIGGADKGYIGHQAARMMQRSKSIERRQSRDIAAKKELLKNLEETEPLQLHVHKADKARLVQAEDVALGFGERMLFSGLSFHVNEGERIAVQGPNGCGKSTLLKLVLGEVQPCAGRIRRYGGLVVSTLPQSTDFLHGSLRAFSAQQGLDDTLFLALLRKLDFERDAFGQEMQSYSAGQKKKVCIAASLAKPAHLFVWDEPLNYIDVQSREQLEAAVLHSAPALLFVEHDAEFVQNVATGCIRLGNTQKNTEIRNIDS